MGPSMIVDGETPWGSWSERCTGRFNGAVDDRRRRVLSAASDEQPEVHASMGPSMIVDGEACSTSRGKSTRFGLQWGRR